MAGAYTLEASAVAWPIPDAPPVTRTALPANVLIVPGIDQWGARERGRDRQLRSDASRAGPTVAGRVVHGDALPEHAGARQIGTPDAAAERAIHGSGHPTHDERRMATFPADHTVRWGIIGCGDVTEVKSGPGLQKADHSALVAVMRRNGALAADYARRHGVRRWYDDADALIADPEVDAVYVATPPDSHMDHALRAARAGKPVYVEKPMARTAAECATMIDACRAAGVPLFVAYYRRALPRFARIRELIDGGAIGDVRLVTVTLHQPLTSEELDTATLPWRVDPRIAGGGRFVDLASHMLDFLDHALGPIRDVQGFAANQGGRYAAEDVVAGSFVFESGVHAVGAWSFTAGIRQDRTEIIGTAGRISYATFGTDPIVVTTQAGTSEIAIDHPAHIQQPLIQTVVDALRGTGSCPSTGESAARTSWVMDRMLAGFRATGAHDTVSRPGPA